MQNSMKVSVFDDEEFIASKSKERRYIKGAEMFEMSSILTVLASWSASLSGSEGQPQTLREGIFGKPFDENTWPLDSHVKLISTPIKLFSENARIYTFLMAELPQLRNLILQLQCDIEEKEWKEKGSTMSIFIITMIKFFRDRKLTTELVFTVYCWLKSVIYLQGDSFISRTVSLLKGNMHTMYNHVSESILKGVVKKADKKLQNGLIFLKQLLELFVEGLVDDKEGIRVDNLFQDFYRHNPLGAAIHVLYIRFNYLSVSCEVFHVTSRFRAFGHLYSALVDRQLIPPIKFLDDLLEVYKKMIFYPARPSFGSFVSCYQLSSHLTAASVSAINGKISTRSNTNRVKKRHTMHAFELSKVFKYLVNDDENWKDDEVFRDCNSYVDFIKRLGEVSTNEILQSRVFSRDSLVINDELYEVFEEMTDLLDRRSFYEHYLLTGKCNCLIITLFPLISLNSLKSSYHR